MKVYYIKFYDANWRTVGEEIFAWRPTNHEIEHYMIRWKNRIRYTVRSWPVVDQDKFVKICNTKAKTDLTSLR